MKKFTILVDMDDTIENLCEAWVAALNERHKTGVSVSDVVEWNMCKAFPELTRTQVYAPLFEESFWNTVKPIEGAPEALYRLIVEGHRVVIVTASHPDTVSMKLNSVLFKYFPFLTYKDVIVASQKDLICGDIVIDDNPMNLEPEKTDTKLNILFTAPHNIFYNAGKNGFFRADNWKDVLSYIEFYSYLKTDLK